MVLVYFILNIRYIIFFPNQYIGKRGYNGVFPTFDLNIINIVFIIHFLFQLNISYVGPYYLFSREGNFKILTTTFKGTYTYIYILNC
jgi:hypothetical protein